MQVAWLEDWNAFSVHWSGNTTVNSCTGSILDVTSTSTDPIIDFGNALGSWNPVIYRYIQVRYKIVSGTGAWVGIFFYNTEYTSASADTMVNTDLVSDNAWHVLTIDMSENAHWFDSNITGFRYDWCSANTVNAQLDYIMITSKPDSGSFFGTM